MFSANYGVRPVTGPLMQSSLTPGLACAGKTPTKGGPKTNTHGQVLDDMDQPIQRLYGVGNCVASASARAYWAGGGTLGPILAFAYRTAAAVDDEARRELPGVAV
jgi:3-oxosteroid 1-dehydrogenase